MEEAAHQQRYATCVSDGTLDSITNTLHTLQIAESLQGPLSCISPRIVTENEVTTLQHACRIVSLYLSSLCTCLQHEALPPIGTKFETTKKIQKTGQIFEMSTVLGRAFKHSDTKDAQKAFTDMDTDGNGVIDLDELMIGLQKAGVMPQELEDVARRMTILFEEGFELDFELFCMLSSIGSSAQETEKAGQLLEMSTILGRAFKHSDVEDARKSFDEMDVDGNGIIDLDELMTGLHNAGFTSQELEDFAQRVPVLYKASFELDFDLFVSIVCPRVGAPDLGELVLDIRFRQVLLTCCWACSRW